MSLTQRQRTARRRAGKPVGHCDAHSLAVRDDAQDRPGNRAGFFDYVGIPFGLRHLWIFIVSSQTWPGVRARLFSHSYRADRALGLACGGTAMRRARRLGITSPGDRAAPIQFSRHTPRGGARTLAQCLERQFSDSAPHVQTSLPGVSFHVSERKEGSVVNVRFSVGEGRYV